MKPVHEQRGAQRVNLKASIQLLLPSGEKLVCESYDFSDTGLYVFLRDDKHDYFPKGSQLRVQFQGLNYTPPIVLAEVVRHDSRGLGMKIISSGS